MKFIQLIAAGTGLLSLTQAQGDVNRSKQAFGNASPAICSNRGFTSFGDWRQAENLLR